MKTAEHPDGPFVPTLTRPTTSGNILPTEEITRQNSNAAFLMVLHYVNRVLEILKRARNSVLEEINSEIPSKALVDASPIESAHTTRV